MTHHVEESVLLAKVLKLNKTQSGLRPLQPYHGKERSSTSETPELIWGELFKDISTFTFEEPKKEGWLFYPVNLTKNSRKNPIELYAVNLKFNDNRTLCKFNVDSLDQANLVLNYGKPFSLDLHFCRQFDQHADKIQFQFCPDRCSFGDKTTKAFAVDLNFDTEIDKNEFPNDQLCAILVEKQNTEIIVEFRLDKKLTPGWWKMKIISSLLKPFVENIENNVHNIIISESVENVSVLSCIYVMSLNMF